MSRRALVAVLAAATLVAGCGGQGAGTQQGTDTVRLVSWFAGSDLGLLKKTLADFTKSSGIKVEVVQVPSASYGQKINAQVTSKTLPDVFWCSHLNSSPIGLGSQGVLYDWSKYENGTASGAKDTGVDFAKFAPGLLDLFRGPNGQLWGIPNEVNTYGFFYNAESFKKANLPVPSADWTWDDLFSDVAKLTKKSASGKTTQYGMQTAWGLLESPIGIAMYSLSNGGRSLAPQSNWSGVKQLNADPKFLEGAKRIRDAVTNGYITGPDFLAPNALGAFTNGDIPLLHAGQWVATSFFDAKPKFEWGYVPMPKGSSAQVAPAESNAFCSPKDLKNPEATWKVISWMLTKGFNDAYEQSPIAPIAYVPGSQGYFKNLDKQGGPGQSVRATVEQELNNPIKLGTLFLDPWASKALNVTTSVWNPALGGKKPLEPSVQQWIDGINKVISSGQ